MEMDLSNFCVRTIPDTEIRRSTTFIKPFHRFLGDLISNQIENYPLEGNDEHIFITTARMFSLY